MKLIFCLGIALSTQLALAQSSLQFMNESNGTISLKCTVGDYHVYTGENFTQIHLDNGTSILKAGAPDVEKLTTAVIVDDQKGMEIHVTESVYEEFTNINILPSKGNLMRTVDPNSVPHVEGEQYLQNAFYPGNLASLDDAYIQNQFRAQSVHFFPVQYNPVTKVLRVYSNIEIDILPTEQAGYNPLPANVPTTINATMKEVYANRFLNYSSNENRYDQIDEMGNILVIAQAQYMEELAPWVQWKKEKGFPTEVVDVAGMTSIAAISSYVENYYNTNGLTYLIFVGDENQVPVELVNNSGGQGYCDPCYGYISGNDSYSEVFIGRFLVHNDEELIPFITKILEYEKTPDTSTDWFSVAMGLGSDQGEGFGDDGEADWQHNNNIKEDLLAYTYTEVWEKYDGSHSANSPSGGATADANGSPAASGLTTVINNGCSLINYTGHGAHNLIVTGSYTNTQINALDNHGFYPYFIIVGCCTGDYDDDDASGDTFGEAWIKSTNAANPTGGIGGAFSSVYQSWAPPMEGQDEMNKIITDMSSINTRHTLGSIHYHGCAGMNDVYGADGDEMTDTWILMADPSMQLRTAMPVPLVATHTNSVFIGTTELTVSCDTEDAMVGLTYNGEILATGFISGGQVILSFSAVQTIGQLLVTVTSFNTIPYQQTIDVEPADGPYILGHMNAFHDLAGNNNGLADYNEQITFDVTAENSGVDPAFNVIGVLTCSDPSIVIDVNTHAYGDLAIAEVVPGLNAFSFHVDGYIQDQTVVTFSVLFSDQDGNTWTASFNQIINAPLFVCGETFIIDDSDGNNNGRMDGGESVVITIPVTNSGHAATAVEVSAALSENSSFTSISMSPISLGVIGVGVTLNASFTVSIDAAAPINDAMTFNLTTSSDYYGANCDYDKSINLNMEDWETGNDNSFPWTYSGSADWFISSQEVFEGTYSMQSGDIGNVQSTTLVLTTNFETAGDVSFMFKTSTENTYDFLKFKIDATQHGSWSGENDWTQASYPVSAGAHTLSWIYVKDNTTIEGSDACWVDNIVLPQLTPTNTTHINSEQSGIIVYPNPINDEVNFALSNQIAGDISISVQNALGETIQSTTHKNQIAGKRSFSIDSSAWSSGIYFVNLKSSSGIFTEKVVKK